jgi:hypothetical protein
MRLIERELIVLRLVVLRLVVLGLIPGRLAELPRTEVLDVGPGRRGGVSVDGHVIARDQVTPDSLVAVGVPAAGLTAARVQPVTPSRPGCVP